MTEIPRPELPDLPDDYTADEQTIPAEEIDPDYETEADENSRVMPDVPEGDDGE